MQNSMVVQQDDPRVHSLQRPTANRRIISKTYLLCDHHCGLVLS